MVRVDNRGLSMRQLLWARKNEYPDQMEWFWEFDRQERAMTGELLVDLPDEYLSPEELKEREQRRAAPARCRRRNWGG